MDMVVNTINEKDVHVVEYLKDGGNVSVEGSCAIVDYLSILSGSPLECLKSSIENGNFQYSAEMVVQLGGAGLNVPTSEGSHSFIVGCIGMNRAIVSGHEVFGHGIPSSKGSLPENNNQNAVRTTNLMYRVSGSPNRDDGAKHNGGWPMNSPYDLPYMNVKEEFE